MSVRIIAEVASAHGGDMQLAKRFIKEGAEAGADTVKFQSWQASTLRDGAGDPQYAWFQQAELTEAQHQELIDACAAAGVSFLTTCFDVGRIKFLASLGLKEIKVSSPDLTSKRLLTELRAHFDHVIVSTGLAHDDEIGQAAEWLAGGRFTFLHCISKYPMEPEDAHLANLHRLRQYTPSVGWSDHAIGTEVAELAIAMGADVVEKHFCLSREGPGRVNPWDATPAEMARIRHHATRVEAIAGGARRPSDEALEAARQRFIGRWGDNA